MKRFFSIKNPLFPITLMASIILLNSCTTSFQDKQIKDIPGEWEVFQLTTLFLNFVPFKPSIEETGDLGFFEFTKSSVDYTFVRNDSLYSNSGPFSIDQNHVSQKIIFSGEENSFLLPPDNIHHEIRFTDSDGFTVMDLVYYPDTEDPTEGYILRLRKAD